MWRWQSLEDAVQGDCHDLDGRGTVHADFARFQRHGSAEVEVEVRATAAAILGKVDGVGGSFARAAAAAPKRGGGGTGGLHAAGKRSGRRRCQESAASSSRGDFIRGNRD